MIKNLGASFIFSLLLLPLFAQETINELERKELIQQLSKILLDNYVFPEQAKKMSELILDRSQQGHYQRTDDPQQLAKQLTSDLQSISQDRHLRVLYEPERISAAKQKRSPADSLKKQASYLQWLKETNYGFKEVEILPGNIGYLNITRFSEPELASTKADAMIELLKDTDAIIFDLRQNGGGTPQMVQWIISYFFDGEPFLLNSFYKREGNYIKQFWTLPHPTEKRLPKVKLYVLTSKRTFSAAEEFAYDLKHLKRAIIVGETTGGGAHPGGRITASEKFNLWTPTARAINPITGSNWEGIGVQADIQTEAAAALKVAQLEVLRFLKAEQGSSNYDQLIEQLEAQ